MTEKSITIPCDNGSTEEMRVLCSFDYEGNHYFIAVYPTSNEPVYGQMRRSIFNGTHYLDKPISEKALAAAECLFEKGRNIPSYYKMNGEHYKVKYIEHNGKSEFRYMLQKSKTRFFTPPAINFSLSSYFSWSFLAAVICALICAYVCTEICGIKWAVMIFPNMPRKTLKLVIYVIELLGTSLLFGLRDDDELDLIECYTDALVPISMITIIGLAKANRIARIIIIGLSVLFCVYIVISFISIALSDDSPEDKKFSIDCTLDSMLNVFLIFFFICTFAINIFGISGYSYGSSIKSSYENPDAIMSNYSEAIENINENVWINLNSQQRVDTLQSICDYECANSLGCNTASVIVGYTSNEDVLGEYNYITNTILVNTELVDEAPVYDVVNTLLHEVRHVYQHSVVKMLNDVESELDEEDLRLYIFQYAFSMRDSFDNYVDGERDFDGYYSQEAEEDSRLWAGNTMCYRYSYYIHEDSIDEDSTE